MNDHLIFMVNIRSVPPGTSQEYHKILKTLISSCSHQFKSHLLSPYSITIGHEFLGIPSNLKSAIDSLLYFEETSLDWSVPFKISYIIRHGKISSKLSKKTSIHLRGEGISEARKELLSKKSTDPRILFHIKPESLSEQLNRLFMVLDSITSRWNPKDFPLISDMLQNENNEEVAVKHRKNRSQIWKRRKSLLISEYKALKQIISGII